ncbi:carboxylate-amine ligase [Rathayibacter tanaceti]|uniref:Carboxylate-amine ligase n=2 Tax=Rathayibacter tanaceti TaxID=1671680 RepID=A0ACD2XGD8_9MICO|nr:glutamate--cysteine ligase [Rathayibacter tanaceti]TCO33770.1 carboxylate-amine ligase [Rathayibacter tanaceti]
MRTFGVEEEYLLVDASTFVPSPVAPLLLRSARASAAVTLAAELKVEQIEAVGAPATTHDELLAGLVDGRRLADDSAGAAGARAVAVGTSPAAFVPHLSADERYTRIAERFGLVAREQFTCGLHVHVGVTSPEEGIAVLDRLRGWLPALLALSANSPFCAGADTGFQSWRYQSWGRWPTAGPAEVWGDVDRYRSVVAALTSCGVLLDEGMLYFDARLSRAHPTVEVRIADVPLHAEDAALIAVLTRALAETAVRDQSVGVAPAPLPTPVIAASSWLASRHGTTGDLVDPLDGRPAPARAVLARLLDHAGDALEEAGDRDVAVLGIERVLSRGTGAERQRAVWERTGEVAAVLADAAQATRA